MRILGIDKMRAVAALSVLLAHVAAPHFPGLWRYIFTGHPAVIAFFVISGFCIHRPYVDKPLHIPAFLTSRAVRIMIPVLIALGCAQTMNMRAYNFYDGYILWSIVCELWYYALYPLFYLLSKWVSWRAQFVVALFASYGVVFYFGSDQYGNATIYGPYLNWLVSLPVWLLGCIVAEMKIEKPANVWMWRLLVAGVASLAYWATLNTCLGYCYTMTPFGLLAAGWLRAEIANADSENGLDRLGKACFSIYLIHMPAVTLLAHFGITDTLLQSVGALVISVVFFFIIEYPSHKLARMISRRIEARYKFATVDTRQPV